MAMAQMTRTAGALIGAALVLGFSAQAQAQSSDLKPGSQRGLGLTGASTPGLLKQIRSDPYKAPASPACETIPRELLALDKVLGPDVDEAKKVKTSTVDMAEGAARSMIPYG